MERCIGCGIAAAAHPYVGVGRANLETGEGAMVAHPVCALCWADPTHRTLMPAPKVAYFTRDHSAVAVSASNALDAKSKRGEDIGLG